MKDEFDAKKIGAILGAVLFVILVVVVLASLVGLWYRFFWVGVIML
jgi:hypothetical protein